jgi:hypothetical protein
LEEIGHGLAAGMRMRTSRTSQGSAPSDAKSASTTSVSQDLKRFSPYQVLNDAVKAVPSVKYALGIAGVVAAVAIIQAFRIGYRVAFFGAIVMFVLMVLLFIFAKLTRTAQRHFVAPVVVLMWSFLLLAIGTACLLFTSVFFRFPLDLRNWLKSNSIAQGSDRGAEPALSMVLAKGVPSAPAQPRRSLELGFEILAMRDGTDLFVPLDEGGELASSVDDYCILVSPSTSGYLYVLQQDAAGQIQWLFPANDVSEFSSGSNPVAPGEVLTVPADREKVLFLDSTMGTETVVAAFSATPWLELESALRAEAKNKELRAASAAKLNLLAGNRGAGGMRRVPASTVNFASVESKRLNGRAYRLPAPLELNQSSGDFLVVKQSFNHVEPKK